MFRSVVKKNYNPNLVNLSKKRYSYVEELGIKILSHYVDARREMTYSRFLRINKINECLRGINSKQGNELSE